ncbi:aminotransferase class V-fold PLP-dependent enzyme [Kibdelosporangium phytohabitans]|uniref:Aminotransferase n=1 Tax=Kibdelosporangium phytohabitans TaxID=860235 RepID=A0A0N9I595_9PSEU|nr:aminotransferase class V-fold PLP-dependent enzyme [Kibdelosporangium phytohabitans]ALG09556.1 aminotransferase [Kibdelosporangium phytohabitans]MBE1469127.1 selenocysteine lyase/cysteine desulfurase [Kibdelosporangium phytohabitans]
MPAKLTSDQFRDNFPMLSGVVHLAACSQGALSGELQAALAELTAGMARQGAPWDAWMGEVAQARRRFAALIGAADDEVAMVPCASDGAYQVASTQDWSARPVVVTTDMEFPSIGHVWLAQAARGAQVVHVPERGATVDADELVAAIDERAALVSIPAASYRNGARMPVVAAVARAREAGAKVFVDAYQATGVLPVDVRELDCDYLVSGALKYMLGLPGVAFLYVRDGIADDVPPQLTGWFGRVDPFGFDPRTADFPANARRFETGTPAIPSVYAANAGMRLLSRVDVHEVGRHVTGLAASTAERLLGAGERLWLPESPIGPQVALVDDNPDRLAAYLAERRIITAPRGAVLRLSYHYYNNESDVDALCSAIADYRSGS